LNYTKLSLVFALGAILLLSAVASGIDPVEALKSKGTKNTKYGSATKDIVCGDKLCSEIKKSSGRGTVSQQAAMPQILPDTILSLDFNSDENSNVISDENSNVISDENSNVISEENSNVIYDENNNGYLLLEGNYDSLKFSLPDSDVLKSLSISIWIKPDFSQRVGEFAIISKENSFNLSVNNFDNQKNIVEFSIFDGITWTTAKSKNSLEDQWNHLIAIYDGDSIKLLVNRVLDDSAEIKPTRQLDSTGKTVTKVAEQITSDKDIVIGAYITTSRSYEKFNNQFSGKIDDILVFDDSLLSGEVNYIFKNDKPLYDNRNEYAEKDLVSEFSDSLQ